MQYKNYSIETYSGTVSDIQQRSETDVSGSGSYGHVTVTSKINSYLRFFLTDEQGIERDFQIDNWDVAMRIGHQIQVFAVLHEGKGVIAAIKNTNLNDISINKLAFKQFARSLYFPFLLISIALFLSPIVFGLCMMFFEIYVNETLKSILSTVVGYSCLGCLIFYHVQWRRLYFRLQKQFKQILQS